MTKKSTLNIRNTNFEWGKKTYLMGIVNVTPDSFSEEPKQWDDFVNLALLKSRILIQDGADILDIGGQSTRPGAETVTVEEELKRVIPVVIAIREILSKDIPISIDTTRSEVAEEALKVGADIINDISGATYDEKMLSVVANYNASLVLMHIRGNPKTMQNLTNYDDLIGEIYQFLEARIEAALLAGIKRSHLIIDPGIGFAKTWEQNLEIIRNISTFSKLELPILIGTSRKSFIGKILNKDNPKQRVWGTAATCCAAIEQGADILRVHDVYEINDVCRVADAIYRQLTINN